MRFLLYIAFLLSVSTVYSQQPSFQKDSGQSKLRIPAEWEEVQAVIISWPYLKYSSKDNVKEVYEHYRSLNSVWTKLAATIQQECEVWIRIYAAQDSVSVKKVMAEWGVPLKRYKFLVFPGENFWVRDYGPISFYYGDQDSIGMLGTRYHHFQNTVNHNAELAGAIAAQMNYKFIRTPLFYEGGNLDTDGHHNVFFTSRVYQVNINQNRWSRPAILDTMRSVFHAEQQSELHDLHCDGGTGHIDMFFKMLDEETIALAEYPETVNSPDRRILEENLLKLKELRSVYNTPFKIVRIPMPASDNGSYENKSCDEISLDPRSYLNGLFVNKTYILPVFSDNFSGDVQGDARIIELFKTLLPGYRIVPVDSRILSIVAGGIHCVTMQVPAENPIRFQMKDFPKGKVILAQEYTVSAKISNKNGIRDAVLNWRKRGDTEWTSQHLLGDARGNTRKSFSAAIDGSGYKAGDTIDYYLKAESYNGKVMTRPMTAPLGCFSFIITDDPGSDKGDLIKLSTDLFALDNEPSPEGADFFLKQPHIQSQTGFKTSFKSFLKLLFHPVHQEF